MKIIVKILLVIPALVVAECPSILKDFSAKTENFQQQVNQQISSIKTSYSAGTSGELVQMWLSVDETMGDIENIKMGIGNMIAEAEVNCVEKCPTKYDEVIQEADRGYQDCLRRTHQTSEMLIKDFLGRIYQKWRQRNNLQLSKLYELFHREIRGNPINATIESLEAEVKSSSLNWDNKEMMDLTTGEMQSKDELRSTGISTFTCFMIVRNGLFGKIKEIEAFLNDNCFDQPQILGKSFR